MKIYTIIAGANGVGKTSLYQILKSSDDLGERINIDEIVSAKGSWMDKLLQIKATRTAMSMLNKYIANEITFHQETTLPGNVVLKQIKKAKEKAETLKETMCGDIIINIASGTYVLGETENFDADNGGKDNYKIIYKGTDKENPPVISGGRKVIGWQKESNGIYSAPLEGKQVRDLYVGDYPAKRARSSYIYFYFTLGTN